MLRISRFGLVLLLLNLTLVGQELACAHEAQAAELPASTAHSGSPSHHQDPAPEPGEQPCDEDASQCCDAIASCTIVGILGQAGGDCDPAHPDAAVTAVTEAHLTNAPLEVAIPPPRR